MTTQKAIESIEKVKSGDLSPLKIHKWLMLLWTKEEKDNVNIENFKRLEDVTRHSVLEYVYRTLMILEEEKEYINSLEYSIIEEVLCWSEVAKCGCRAMRKKFENKGYILSIHNIGSAQIYREYNKDVVPADRLELVYTLIETHGLIGQYLRGETSITRSLELVKLSYPDVNMKRLLCILNKCIIKAVFTELYDEIKNDVDEVIDNLISLNFHQYLDDSTVTRFKKFRKKAIQNGENFEEAMQNIYMDNPQYAVSFRHFLSNYDFWYVEGSTANLKALEIGKLFVYVDKVVRTHDKITDISFENLQSLYTDYKGKKTVNIFKERFLEAFLKDFDPFSDTPFKNEHLEIKVIIQPPLAKVELRFSEIAEKFLDFCMAGFGQGAIYDQIISEGCRILQISRDTFDRLYNEDDYLNTMNASTDDKQRLVEYLLEETTSEGKTIVDIGPGGGELMNRIVEEYPDSNVIGLDFSKSVIEYLENERNKNKRRWNVQQGDALKIDEIFKPGEVHSFSCCSINHEIFSFNGFSYEALKKMFRGMFTVLPQGGRLAIRDGVMTEGDSKGIIGFLNPNGLEKLERYARDFKGRDIQYEILDPESVNLPANEKADIYSFAKLPINDSMEFNFTYTWGEDSYFKEVKEQFGYFTPKEYIKCLHECAKDVGCDIRVIGMQHYLLPGYTENLSKLIKFYDEEFNETSLPDSTIFLIVEKI